MSLTKPERETIVTMNDEDDIALVWTAQRPIITRLKKNPAARLIEEGAYGTSVWARFEIPKQLMGFRSKRREATATSGQGFRKRELPLERAK